MLRTLGAFWSASGSELYLIEALASGGELFDWVRARKGSTLAEVEQRRIAYELLEGLRYLHEHGVIHRDIKPSNILLESSSDKAPLIIADFGLCRRWRMKVKSARPSPMSTRPVTSLTKGGKPGGSKGDLEEVGKRGVGRSGDAPEDLLRSSGKSRRPRAITKQFAGTPEWMAPEVVVCAHDDAEGYTFPCDVWSAGAVLFAVVAGLEHSPFAGGERGSGGERSLGEIFEAILACDVPWGLLPEGAAQPRDFLQALLTLKPDERRTAAESLRHPWLASHTPTAPNLSPGVRR